MRPSAPYLSCHDQPRPPDETARRRALLGQPSQAPLAAFAATPRARLPGLVPDMDPLDGGTRARVLLLLEKPGPGAARSGFVSRDNPGPTSATIRDVLGREIPPPLTES